MAMDSAQITLEIIVKSHKHGSFCYLGVDRISGRILRPKGNAALIVGRNYTFTFSKHQQASLTQLPHRNEDLLYGLATWNPIVGPSIRDYLLSIAPPFSNIPQQVFEGTDCPSVYLLLCMPSNIERYTKSVVFNGETKYKRRINISTMKDGNDLPYTDAIDRVLDNSKPVVVVFSMSQPINPNICYLLVVGLIQA